MTVHTARHSVSAPLGVELKGNQVRILNRPAAVSYNKRSRQKATANQLLWEGAKSRNESEDLPMH